MRRWKELLSVYETMLPNFLAEDAVRRENGQSPALEIGGNAGAPLLVTLGITRIVEQESLDVEIQGSADGQTWQPKALAEFPQKFYCGTYSILLDLSATPEVAFLRAAWKMNRWGRGDTKASFGFFVFAEPAGAAVAASQ